MNITYLHPDTFKRISKKEAIKIAEKTGQLIQHTCSPMSEIKKFTSVHIGPVKRKINKVGRSIQIPPIVNGKLKGKVVVL
jgi:hypothetical protein